MAHEAAHFLLVRGWEASCLVLIVSCGEACWGGRACRWQKLPPCRRAAQGYLLGVPVAAYSLALGSEHTDFAEGKLQRRLIEGVLDAETVDLLSIIAMAGERDTPQTGGGGDRGEGAVQLMRLLLNSSGAGAGNNPGRCI